MQPFMEGITFNAEFICYVRSDVTFLGYWIYEASMKVRIDIIEALVAVISYPLDIRYAVDRPLSMSVLGYDLGLFLSA